MIELPTDSPTLTDLLRVVIRAELRELFGSNIARVISYDQATQRATVQLVTRRWRVVDGVEESYLPEPIPGVPVAFPGAGAASLVFPVAAGTTGLVAFADSSLAEWLATGNDDNTPEARHTHDINDAVFIPGARPFIDPVPAAGVDAAATVLRASELRLGDSSATKKVTLADDLLPFLTAIVNAINNHTHSGVTVGAGSSGTTSIGVIAPTLGDIASTTVKAT